MRLATTRSSGASCRKRCCPMSGISTPAISTPKPTCPITGQARGFERGYPGPRRQSCAGCCGDCRSTAVRRARRHSDAFTASGRHSFHCQRLWFLDPNGARHFSRRTGARRSISEFGRSASRQCRNFEVPEWQSIFPHPEREPIMAPSSFRARRLLASLRKSPACLRRGSIHFLYHEAREGRST